MKTITVDLLIPEHSWDRPKIVLRHDLVVEVGDRALFENQVTTYWASLGYEAIPKTTNFP